MAIVVLDHVLDEHAGVYRVIFGTEITRDVPQLDQDGDPVLDEDRNPVTHTESYYEDVEEIVFAADDKRWQTKTGRRRAHEEVAAEQRELIRGALDERARAAEQAAGAPAPQPLPGAGEAL